MNFPLTRHDQRYEYVLRKGYIDDKVVLDIGCGSYPYGATMLSAKARMVIGIDPDLKGGDDGKVWSRATNSTRQDIIKYCSCRVEEIVVSGPTEDSVAVCMEVLEHVQDPVAFVRHVASLAKYAFYTTPLARVTGSTRNPEHVAEYSHVDFCRILDTAYHVRDIKYQLGDMRIVDDAGYDGDSIDHNHVVQMAWCERR